MQRQFDFSDPTMEGRSMVCPRCGILRACPIGMNISLANLILAATTQTLCGVAIYGESSSVLHGGVYHLRLNGAPPSLLPALIPFLANQPWFISST